MQALFTPKQTSARMENLRTSGRLVAKKPLIVLKNVLKRLQKTGKMPTSKRNMDRKQCKQLIVKQNCFWKIVVRRM